MKLGTLVRVTATLEVGAVQANVRSGEDGEQSARLTRWLGLLALNVDEPRARWRIATSKTGQPGG